MWSTAGADVPYESKPPVIVLYDPKNKIEKPGREYSTW